jgi:hypothetical protein
MHTSAGAAYGRDDGGAPELRVCHSLQNMKLMETRPHVNEMILTSAIEMLLRGGLMPIT